MEQEVVVAARTRGEDPCLLTLRLQHPECHSDYIDGSLCVQMLSMRLDVPLVVSAASLRTFMDEARRLDAQDLDTRAVLWDYDAQPVLVLSWVPVAPPVIVMSGEYISAFCHAHGDDPEKYPYRAQNTVQYTGLLVDLGTVDRLVQDLRRCLVQLERQQNRTECHG